MNHFLCWIGLHEWTARVFNDEFSYSPRSINGIFTEYKGRARMFCPNCCVSTDRSVRGWVV